MVPPRPVALGVCSSTPPIRRMATATCMITSAWLIWCMERTKVYRARASPRPVAPLPLGRRQALVDGVPVDRVPPGGHVVGTPVLVLEVVRVLPDVDAQDRHPALRYRVVLVREALDHQLAAGQVGPAPAAAELADARLAGSVLVGGEVTERRVDGVRDRPGRLTTPVRGHDGPEDRVVQVPAAVVAHHGADVVGQGAQVAEQLLDALAGKLGV